MNSFFRSTALGFFGRFWVEIVLRQGWRITRIECKTSIEKLLKPEELMEPYTLTAKKVTRR